MHAFEPLKTSPIVNSLIEIPLLFVIFYQKPFSETKQELGGTRV